MFHRVISRAWMNCNLTIFSRWIMISLLWVFTLSSTFTWYYLLNSKNILTLAPYLSEQVKYAKEKRYPVLNLFTSNERAKLNILETIPDSILLKGEWPRVSCEKKKQTNKQKKNLKQSVAKTITSVAQKKFLSENLCEPYTLRKQHLLL